MSTVDILDPCDHIPFHRCTMKLRRIDKEMLCLRISGIKVHDQQTGETSQISYDVHDVHVYSSFGHILSMMQDAEAMARQIENREVRLELLHDVGIRRAAFMLIMKKIIDKETTTKLYS